MYAIVPVPSDFQHRLLVKLENVLIGWFFLSQFFIRQERILHNNAYLRIWMVSVVRPTCEGAPCCCCLAATLRRISSYFFSSLSALWSARLASVVSERRSAAALVLTSPAHTHTYRLSHGNRKDWKLCCETGAEPAGTGTFLPWRNRNQNACRIRFRIRFLIWIRIVHDK